MVPLATALPNLRILPLGDSITKGSGSSGINGYRGPLREKLLDQGMSDDITVDMIGTLRHGTMPDNDHEGHSGDDLADINRYWRDPIKARPNVVLVHAGTNNMDLEIDLDTAIDLMTSIVDGLFQNAPDVTVLVAPVIWANKPAMQANTDRFNPQVESLIKSRQQQGKHILPVHIDITVSDLSDLKHPNNRGYEKMANAWLQAILEADSRGWLKDPVKMSPSDAPGLGLGNAAAGADGVGNSGDRIWEVKGTVFEGFRTWEAVGTIRSAVENASRDKVILADLNGDGITDYVVAYNGGAMRAWINGGTPNDWTSIGTINPDWSSITGDMIRMADVDNDGKADLIVLYSDGAAKVWKNTDNGRKFESLDSKWATGLAPRDNVYFEDVDGDGYADYVVISNNGAVKWARNTHNNGKDGNKKNWETAVTIAPGPAGIPANRTRLRDLDGDGKADYLIVYAGGAVKALRNTVDEGGRNWLDLGTIAPGVEGVTGDMIRFADMDGDGLADFLAVSNDGSIRMWKNMGIVGTKGSSLRFADLTGDGKDDIISVDARGRARAWLNQGVDKWESIGEIAPGFDEDLSQARIEFADVNGDKRADYLIIYGGGAVKAYLNNGNLPGMKEGERIWQQGITISPGVGEPGRKVRFADLDGDGYDDFVILYDGGAAKCWLNNRNIPPTDGGRIWKEGIEVATGVGEPGSKIRFADLTGDGKADYIVQYAGGAAKAYRNMGMIPDGEGRKWGDMGTVATGVTPQGPVEYADINGDGKADYLVVFHGGAINAYINSMEWLPDTGGGGGDPGDGGGGDDDDDEGESAPPYEPDPKGDEPLAPCPYTPTTMDEIKNLDFNNELPSHCVPAYMVPALHHMLENAVERYNEILDSGYDDYFEIFGDYIVSGARGNMHEFMMNNGSEFFDCNIWSKYACCRSCEQLDLQCEHCIEDCETSTPWSDGQEWRIREMPCPPDMSKRGTNDEYDRRDESIWWSVKSEKAKEKFYAEVGTEVGVPKEKIEWIDHSIIYDTGSKAAGCMGWNAIPKYDDLSENCRHQHWWHDAPWVGDFKVEDVFNPKELIAETLSKIDLREPLAEFSLAIMAGEYENDEHDLVDALIVPISMIHAALDHMEVIVDLGKELEKAELELLITSLLTSVLLIVGGAGSVIASAGMRFLGRSLVAVAEGGNAGLGLYSIVTQPESAPLVIFGLVMSALNIRDVAKVTKAANVRRGMTSKEMNDFSPEAGRLTQIGEKVNTKPPSQNICKWR